MSVFTLLRCESTFVLLTRPPRPLMFQLVNLMVCSLFFWLMSVIESVPKYQSSKWSDDMVPQPGHLSNRKQSSNNIYSAIVRV